MAAIQTDIVLYVGRTYALSIACTAEDPDTFELEVRDLSGWTGAMQVRATADDTTVLATAAVTIDVATGVVSATITDDETAAMTWRSGVYDLIITDGTETDTLAQGTARLRHGVTR